MITIDHHNLLKHQIQSETHQQLSQMCSSIRIHIHRVARCLGEAVKLLESWDFTYRGRCFEGKKDRIPEKTPCNAHLHVGMGQYL